ncbi:hypothetical protein B296_00007952 [Ensete ventricosum]|uniref:BOP1 N-terminal domain-containing protein n=1 Tax=Ensete ventricosum TaxID=4639 RepID=A0A427AHH2_ENSVE|nr:hypothetical protein B296_00007952 [Ensete ventricosum]
MFILLTVNYQLYFFLNYDVKSINHFIWVLSFWHQVVQYVRAIRKGLIKFDKPKEEPRVYLLWGDDSSAAENKRHGLSYIPAPKPKLAGTIYDCIRLKHLKAVTTVEWHRKGDYFTTVVPSDILIMHLLHLLPACELGQKHHYSWFIQKCHEKIRLVLHHCELTVVCGQKKLAIASFSDLKIYRAHPKDITNVAFHRSYPLFASCSDDCTAYVFHGMVYSDLNQNPLIVPLEILRGHTSSDGRGQCVSGLKLTAKLFDHAGVLDCKFHPRQPWLFTAGADSIIKLYCH